MSDTNIKIVTSAGRCIPAHASIMASASPVLEKLIEYPQNNPSSERTIRIPGFPCDAVAVFVQFVCTTKECEEQMDYYGVHLLALSHVYSVTQLKRKCTKALTQRLTIDNVSDLVQLAKLCDAPDLYLYCMKLIYTNFKAVENTEGWRFLQNHYPSLELDILKFIDDDESRKKRSKKMRAKQNLYIQLNEAMESLEHICKEGCTSIGPCDMEPVKSRSPCSKFNTCEGLQLSIRHFATCKKKVNGGCIRCKSTWQLLRLHSSICDQPDICKVPLCRQFKTRGFKEKNGDDATRWMLLVRKIMSAKVVSSLAMPKKKRVEEATEKITHRHQIKGFESQNK